MNVLIVLGHPERKSFNGALKERAAEVLAKAGHGVRVSDLYAMGFEARLDRADVTTARDPAFFHPIREQAHAWKQDSFAADIKGEIEKLTWMDLLIIQCPVWWFGLPAVVKGWLDRVFVPGFTYGRGKWYETGGLAGKRALLSMTVDATPRSYGPRGRYGRMDVVLWPILESLRFVGLDVLEPHVAYEVSGSAEGRAQTLERYAARLAAIEGERPVFFHPLGDYEDDVLKPGVAPGPFAQRD